jgi:hypothetical protein
MKQIFVSTAFAMAFAVMAVGCASETTEGSGEFGSVSVNLLVGDTDVKAVSFELVCESGFALNGQFNVNDEQDPPIWAAIMDVPVPNPETGEPCSIVLVASDDAGNVLCTGEQSFVVEVNETVKVDVVLLCGDDGDDPLGNIDIDATFEIVEGNNCPRLHFLNAVPDEVPANPVGSEVTVWVSDKDGDTLNTELTATGGSFEQASSVLTNTADPVSVLTTYFCDGAAGAQTISVTVSDGEAACDKSTSFDVTCPGVNECEGVVCEDDGNVCTDAECNPATGQCETSNNANECSAGGELTINGGFETGDLEGWTQFCTTNGGTCEATMAQANGGLWSGNVVTTGAPSDPLFKQANIGIGTVTPNSEVSISFDLYGSLTGASGVVFAEFFSELSGGGISKGEILSGGPLFPTGEWVTYSYTVTTGDDVSGGVTLQLKAGCGAVSGCVVDAYFDNVSVIFGDGGAGTCDEGVCVPNAECTVAADCPDDGNECIDAVCDAGTCGTSNNTNECDGGNGTCSAGVCVPDAECTVPADCPDDGNECTDAVCDAGACGTSNNTNECDGGNGTCGAGVCEPNAEVFYSEDFESLDQTSGAALGTAPGGAGFLVFGNEFQPDGTPIQGYGPFSAPNGTPGFCSIALGQGGGPQGEQVLVVYSDYNNGANQEAGNLVEANTFQEPFSNPDSLITAADLGTYTFSFDAKRGDINDPTVPRCDPTSVEYTPNPPCDSTAVAFVKTLDPAAGFATTNNITLPMTAIPDTWNRYSITLVVDGALIGQVLQVGFAATATNFEPSGVFYDNLLVTVE